MNSGRRVVFRIGRIHLGSGCRRLVGPLGFVLCVSLLVVPIVAGQKKEVGIKYPGMIAEFDVQIPMRDGVSLGANVYRPQDSAKHPTIMRLTPYGKDVQDSMDRAWEAVQRGYAMVEVDARGRNDSGGTFRPFRDGPDGSDTLDWIAAQPWSNGKIATRGASYEGQSQWMVAKEGNPHLVAMMPYVAPADGFNDFLRYDGVPKLDLIFTWAMGYGFGRVNHQISGFDWSEVMGALPLDKLDTLAGRSVPFWRDSMQHDHLDEYWAPLQMTGNYGRFDVPSFNVTGWYEGQLRGTVQGFVNAVKTSKKPRENMLVIGPWLHGVNRNRKVGDRDAGPEAIIDLEAIQNAWLDHIMLGSPKSDYSNFLYFLPVDNHWYGASAFPIPGTKLTTYYLASLGKANTLNGDGTLASEAGHGDPDSYTYDPSNPVLSVSSRTAGARGGLKQGPVDNRSVEERPDVLVYTSGPLQEAMEVTGPISATVYFSTDVADTDITVKLLDVTTDGSSLNLSEGIARGKYRESFVHPVMLTPGKIYKLNVTLFPTSNYFEAGHRIRVEIASSNFPVFARNLNSPISETGSEIKIAHTRIYHSQEYPSMIVLPVVPKGLTTRVEMPLRKSQDDQAPGSK